MATRADRITFQPVRGDRGRETERPAGAKFVAMKLPYDVVGARNFPELKQRVQWNLDALVTQIENELNRVGRFLDEDGYPRIASAEFFSRVKVE